MAVSALPQNLLDFVFGPFIPFGKLVAQCVAQSLTCENYLVIILLDCL